MALIPCPSCGEQISDKAKACVHCGHILIEEPKKLCAECGAELESGAAICGKCGCPVTTAPTETAEPVKKTHKVRNAVIIAIVAVLVIAAVMVGVDMIRQRQAAAAAQQASQDYGQTLTAATYLMLSGAADSEECGNLIVSVWNNSIHEKKDPETDKYTRMKSGSGSFYDDFNDALDNLLSDSDYQAKISGIESNRESVNAMMKELRNPPADWEDAYGDLQAYYNAYLSMTNLATNPTGSLNSYSEDFHNADTEFGRAYERMKLYID